MPDNWQPIGKLVNTIMEGVLSKMSPKEVTKFIEESRKQADESAKKWHTNPETRALATKKAQAVISKIRDQEK